MRLIRWSCLVMTSCTVGGGNPPPPAPNTTVIATDARLSLTTLVDDAFPNGYPSLNLTNTAPAEASIVEVASSISSIGGMNITIVGDDWTAREPVASLAVPASGTLEIRHRATEIVLENVTAPPAPGESFEITLSFADATVLTV